MKTFTKLYKAICIVLALYGTTTLSAQTCTANFAYTLNANGNVTFSSTSVGTGTATTLYWNFGNNLTYTGWGGNANANTTYTANGTYTVTLFALGAPSCSSSVQYTIIISNAPNCPLNANFSYGQGANGLVNFSNASTGTIVGTTYAWSFGDGGTSATTSPAHTYSANGTYIATLIATSSPTCISTITMAINVTTYCTGVANYTYTQFNNGLVNFGSTSTGTNMGSWYEWKFGDNTTGSGQSTSHTYLNGTYNCLMILHTYTNMPWCVDSIMQVITVSSNTCNLSANFNSNVGLGGLVSFNSTSTGTNGSCTYTWNFGNGFSSNSANPALTYTSGGIYTVTLTVQKAPNCISVITKTVNVNTIPCVANANFVLIPTMTPKYWNAIPALPYNNYMNATWSWGDGSSSNTIAASHQYSVSGLYTICLTVTMWCGATALSCATYSIFRSAQDIINVNVLPPLPINIDNDGVGINNNSAEPANLNIYPNPSDGTFTLIMNNLKSNTVSISICDLLGRTLYSSEGAAENGAITREFHLQNISKGIYFVRITSGDQTTCKKIIVEK